VRARAHVVVISPSAKLVGVGFMKGAFGRLALARQTLGLGSLGRSIGRVTENW